MAANGSDDFLQIVAVLAGDADGFALDLRGDFEFGVANERGDLFGDGLLDALLYFDNLARVAKRGNFGGNRLDAFEADLAFGEFVDDDFVEGVDLELVVGGELDFAFFKDDLGIAAFEIEAAGQLFFRLVDGVLDLHRAYFRYYVK